MTADLSPSSDSAGYLYSAVVSDLLRSGFFLVRLGFDFQWREDSSQSRPRSQRSQIAVSRSDRSIRESEAGHPPPTLRVFAPLSSAC